MARYFFQIEKEGHRTLPVEGLEFSGLHDAWAEATTSFGEMIRDGAGALPVGSMWQMTVSDSYGKVIFRLTFDTEALS